MPLSLVSEGSQDPGFRASALKSERLETSAPNSDHSYLTTPILSVLVCEMELRKLSRPEESMR